MAISSTTQARATGSVPRGHRLAKKKNGSVVIVMQQGEPSEKDVNWLPAPPGQFRLNLRLYGPSRRAINGVWIPPRIENLGPGGGS